MRKSSNDVYCSFCYKNVKEIKYMIASNNVYICDECVDTCNEIIATKELLNTCKRLLK